jgi:hypothetical protein
MIGVNVTIYYDTQTRHAFLVSMDAAAQWVADTLPALIRKYGADNNTAISVRFTTE